MCTTKWDPHLSYRANTSQKFAKLCLSIKNPRARASKVSCIKNKPPSNDTTIIAIIIATAPLSFCQAAVVNSPDQPTNRQWWAWVGWEHYDSLGELTLVCTHARHAATYLNHHLVLPSTSYPPNSRRTNKPPISFAHSPNANASRRRGRRRSRSRRRHSTHSW